VSIWCGVPIRHPVRLDDLAEGINASEFRIGLEIHLLRVKA